MTDNRMIPRVFDLPPLVSQKAEQERWHRLAREHRTPLFTRLKSAFGRKK